MYNNVPIRVIVPDMKEKNEKISWVAIALMAFTTVWSFGNVANGFVYFNGTKVIASWISLFILYFIPYALMVGELGSAFKLEGGGVSSWINRTVNAKAAYYAGWTYWACHVTYIASKGSASLKSLAWAVFRNAETYDSIPTLYIQLTTLLTLFIGCFIASRGIKPLKRILTIGGTCAFVMSILYIILMFAVPLFVPKTNYIKTSYTIKSFVPDLSLSYVTTLSVLVFAVGGCEKTSPYVNKLERPGKDFPKAMIMLASMVVAVAFMGTIAMGKMFDPDVINSSKETFDSYVANSHFWAYQKLGQYYHIGDTFLIVYAITNAISQFAVLVLSIDAPLRMLLDNEATSQYIPLWLKTTNKNGNHTHGIIMVAVLSGSLILIQSIVPGASSVISQLTKLNAVCMPMRYLWVFAAYIALKKNLNNEADYIFLKRKKWGMFAGIWCFSITLICCIFGMYDKDPFVFATNVITPVILTILGLILPQIAKIEKKRTAV